MMRRSIEIVNRPYFFKSAILVFVVLISVFSLTAVVFGQTPSAASMPFRIGEKVTYEISFDRFPSAGFAEVEVVSAGKIENKAVVELKGRFKTTGLFSALTLIDESINSFVSPESGSPVYVKHTNHAAGSPVEIVNNFLAVSGAGDDIISLLFKLRYGGVQGAGKLVKGDRSFPVSFQQIGSEMVIVGAGSFDTAIYEIQSEYFTELGIQSLRVYFDSTGDRVPVLIRAKSSNGEFKVSASSIQLKQQDRPVLPEPTPAPSTPTPTPTPLRTPEPVPYVENRALPGDIPFVLGERLEYSISSGQSNIGQLVLQAKERKLFNTVDSLQLTATISGVSDAGAGFVSNDRVVAQVDPLTLLPQKVDLVFSGSLAGFSQSATFLESQAKVVFGGARSVDVPVGTHSILSLLYAMRSFRLTPTKDLSDPVNDTRVAVFWFDRPYVFVIRPIAVELTDENGEKIPTIQASITTGEPSLDQLQPKVWIGQDLAKTPRRIQIGRFIFDLQSSSVVAPR